ncbi:hypothetical protein BN1723_020427, partial [Verticillium longisporum]
CWHLRQCYGRQLCWNGRGFDGRLGCPLWHHRPDGPRLGVLLERPPPSCEGSHVRALGRCYLFRPWSPAGSRQLCPYWRLPHGPVSRHL